MTTAPPLTDTLSATNSPHIQQALSAATGRVAPCAAECAAPDTLRPSLDLDALHTAGARLIAARKAVFQRGGPAPGSLWELALAERAVLDLVAGGAA